VVDDPKPYALALPGSGGAVVASTRLLQILSARERRAVLAHERAHLAGRHHLFLSVLALAAAANPLMRPVRNAGSLALERWADEAAAASIGDRRALAHALTKTALADHASTAGLALGGHDVPFRVRALMDPPPRRRPGMLLAALVPIALILASSARAGHDLGRLFDTAAVHHVTQLR
jgi:Zn-dependent protease with chaperone function